LSDYKLAFPTQEGAQSSAYLGIRIYFDFEGVTLPSIDSLEWKEEPDADRWVEVFYRKPIWPAPI
jgi:hypothetical protein